jgi:hypothetical protein
MKDERSSESSQAERRRGRRANVTAALTIRRPGSSETQSFNEHPIENISLAGVYFETEQHDAFRVDDVVLASVSIPESDRREFPFTRVAGRSRVVRVRELPPKDAEGRKRFGIALEFGHDITALTTIPSR